MSLYDKLLDGIPIKTVGIWKNEPWGTYNLLPALAGIGELNYLAVPVDRNNCVKDRVAFSDKIFEYVEKIKPDLVYSYVRNRWVTAEPFLEIKKLGIPTINLSMDDTHKFYLVADIAHAFTLNQTSAQSSIIRYVRNNAKAIYLPEGANPKIHAFSRINTENKDIDVCFVGRRYGNRAAVINTIKKDGFEVVVRGQGWPGGQASFEEMVDLYSRSKIVLGFSRTSSDYKTYSIKGRDFEVLMCGAFYMCEKNPELCDWFKPNNEIVFWDNIRDLLPKIRFYLKCEKRRQTIACMGHFRAATEHTWMDRFETLFWYLKEHLGIEN